MQGSQFTNKMHRAIDREERKEERKSEFKKSITSDSATSQRVEEHEKLRKNRRFEHLKRMRKGEKEKEKTKLLKKGS